MVRVWVYVGHADFMLFVMLKPISGEIWALEGNVHLFTMKKKLKKFPLMQNSFLLLLFSGKFQKVKILGRIGMV